MSSENEKFKAYRLPYVIPFRSVHTVTDLVSCYLTSVIKVSGNFTPSHEGAQGSHCQSSFSRSENKRSGKFE